jgi:hypothetical protein
MAKSTFLDFSTTAGDNTDCGGIGILGTNSVSNFDNAFRTLMAILRRDLDNGTVFVTKSGAYTAVANDNNAFYEFTAAATLTLTAAATLGADWHMMVFANGGDVTIDADGTELINGEATLVVSDGDAAYIICTGSAFVAITIPGVAGVAKLDTVNTFTKTQVWPKGADVASASTLTLGDDGNYFDVTGTTAITSIATVGVGTVIKLHFDGILTLTHHATDLILLGGANITTAAGDEAEFVEYAAGDWRCTNYQRASLPPTPIFSKSFESAEQAITSGGPLSVAHGLGVAPKLVFPVLICKTADAGYSVGDIIPMPTSVSSATVNSFSASVEISGATNILVRFGSVGTTFTYPSKSDGSASVLTNDRWRLIIRAYA